MSSQHDDGGCRRSGDLVVMYDQSPPAPCHTHMSHLSRVMRPLPLLTLHIALALGDTAGGPLLDIDPFAPNSVPMMGKKSQLARLAQKRGPRFYYSRSFMPMLRLKKAENEMPYEYKTPWHLGKRRADSPGHKRSASDLYSSAWLGSLFKPSSTEENRRMKYELLKGKHFRAFLILFFVDNCVLLNLTVLFVKILQ